MGEAEENFRLRNTNRVLRRVNGVLRRRGQQVHESSDELFLALCETNPSAEAAWGELWGSGEFDCGPQDYGYMVERCLAAIREYNERRKHPEQVSRCTQ